MKKLLLILLCVPLMFSCGENLDKEITKAMLDDEYTGKGTYTDEDGNLGENNPDVHNLFVQDNRNDIEYKYRIPELSPSGSDISIEGTFNIKINGTGITDESSSQKVNYNIYVKDRVGNKSNTITTSSITIQQ